jgi:hypothetical protein
MGEVMDFLPKTDDGLLAWVNPFATQVVATPTAFGVTTGQATTLTGLVTTFTTKLAAAQNPTTRGPAAILGQGPGESEPGR